MSEMISYKGRRHSEATPSYPSTEAEITPASEASRRISLGANFDKRNTALNSPLSSNTKTRWSSDQNVRPAFIVNNPSTWKTNNQEDSGKWQSKLIRRRWIPGEPTPRKETKNENVTRVTEPSDVGSTKVVELILEEEEEEERVIIQEQPPPNEHIRRNKSEGRLSRPDFDESDFKKWKSQMLNEIKKSNSEAIQPIEKTQKVNDNQPILDHKKRLNALKAELIPGKDDKITIGESFKKSSRIFDAKLATRKLDQLNLENTEAEQIIPKWKKIPKNAKKQR